MKKISTIRLNQVGSFYNFPNWRYLIYTEPERANLAYCRRKPIDGSSCLNRYLVTHKKLKENTTVLFSFTPFILKCINNLNLPQKDTFYKIFNKRLKKEKHKKIFIPFHEEDEVMLWSGKYIQKIQDEHLKKFLYHVANIHYDADYDFAIKYKNSKYHKRNFCVIGYSIFAGLSNTRLAYRYKLYRKQINALRLLFFDFTNAPTDTVARTAYFTQLSDNDIISDIDRRYYKIIGSLGELGLKAEADPSTLTSEEKEKLNLYLADSMVDNVASLYFTIEGKKDALNYNAVINNLATFFIKKEEINYFRSKVKHLDASTARIINERTDYNIGTQEEDIYAIEMISKLALKENTPPDYKIITELQ
jgi:hypothetical protein